jgi:NADH-quinone oxidoreductase subunit N
MTQLNFYSILPLTLLTVWACALLVADLFIPKERKDLTALLAALGLALTLGFTLAQIGQEELGFTGMVVLDGFSIFVNVLLLISGLLGVALAYGYLKRMGLERGEYYTLMLFSITGMMLMAQAADLIIVFIALELLSIPVRARRVCISQTSIGGSGVEILLLGAFATGYRLRDCVGFRGTGTTS